MYVDIKKVFKLAETTLPEKKEEIKKIKENEYYPFLYRGYLFKCEWDFCKWEVVKEAFTDETDIKLEQELAHKITDIVAEFFRKLAPFSY